jgi:hypothetical protein
MSDIILVGPIVTRPLLQYRRDTLSTFVRYFVVLCHTFRLEAKIVSAQFHKMALVHDVRYD